MNKKSLTYGFIVGGVVGAITALLSAPSTGKELRTQLKETRNEWVSTSKELTANMNDLKNSISTLTTEGKEMAIKFISDVKTSISEWQIEIDPNKQSLSNEIQELQKTIEELELKIQSPSINK